MKSLCPFNVITEMKRRQGCGEVEVLPKTMGGGVNVGVKVRRLRILDVL